MVDHETQIKGLNQMHDRAMRAGAQAERAKNLDTVREMFEQEKPNSERGRLLSEVWIRINGGRE